MLPFRPCSRPASHRFRSDSERGYLGRDGGGGGSSGEGGGLQGHTGGHGLGSAAGVGESVANNSNLIINDM